MSARQLAFNLESISCIAEHTIAQAGGGEHKKVAGKTDIWLAGHDDYFTVSENFDDVIAAIDPAHFFFSEEEESP